MLEGLLGRGGGSHNTECTFAEISHAMIPMCIRACCSVHTEGVLQSCAFRRTP